MWMVKNLSEQSELHKEVGIEINGPIPSAL